MGLNSVIYASSVVHDRAEPVKHRFTYPYLAFYLDLEELDTLKKRLLFFSVNRFNLFSFWDRDHIHTVGSSARDRMLSYLREKGVATEGCKIFLLTQLRILGFVFNPVSFYYCFDRNGSNLCAIAEVNNTFKEMKYFFLGPDTVDEGTLSARQIKNFYVSPFIGLKEIFEFQLRVPDQRLHIRINDYRSEDTTFTDQSAPFLRTSLTGNRRALTDLALFRAFLQYPFVTLRVVVAIHWQALRLFLKGVPYYRKNENPELQTEVYHAKH